MNLAIAAVSFFVMLVLGLAVLAIIIARTGWNPVAAIARPFQPTAPAAPAAA